MVLQIAYERKSLPNVSSKISLSHLVIYGHTIKKICEKEG